MKKLIHFAMLFCIMIMLSMDGCEFFTDGKDNCEETKMLTVENPTIYLKLDLDPYAYHELVDMGYPTGLITTKEMLIGSIMKVYCNGKESGSFSYEKTYYPKSMDFVTQMGGFLLPQPYQFKFENNDDYLLVIAHLKTYMDDGKIFEDKNEFTQKYYYVDLIYDKDRNDYYIELDYPSDVDWVEVTSK